MKSIKEKAREAQTGYDDVQAPAVGRGFVLGANYVLDNLSKTISVSEDGYLRDNLKKMIEQLKGIRL
jgi:hypothetical protein